MADFSKAKIVKLDSCSRYQRLFSRDSGTCGIKSGHVILKEGEEIGEHSTNDLEEILVILKGKGQLVVNEAPQAKANSFLERNTEPAIGFCDGRMYKKVGLDFDDNAVLYVPPGTIHNIKNTGSGALEYVFITSNAK